MIAQAGALRASAASFAPGRRREPASRPPPRPRRLPAARASADRLEASLAAPPPPGRDYTVTIQYKETVSVPVEIDWFDEGCTLHNYMMLPVDQYVLLDLPLGAAPAGRRVTRPVTPRRGLFASFNPPLRR